MASDVDSSGDSIRESDPLCSQADAEQPNNEESCCKGV